MKNIVASLILTFLCFPLMANSELSDSEFQALMKKVQNIRMDDFKDQGFMMIPTEIFYLEHVADFFNEWEMASIFPYGENQKELIKNEGIFSLSFRQNVADSNGRAVPGTEHFEFIFEFNTEGEVVTQRRHHVDPSTRGPKPFKVDFLRDKKSRTIKRYEGQNLLLDMSLTKLEDGTYKYQKTSSDGGVVFSYILNSDARLLKYTYNLDTGIAYANHELVFLRDTTSGLITNIIESIINRQDQGTINYLIEWSKSGVLRPLRTSSVSCQGNSSGCVSSNIKNFFFEVSERTLKETRKLVSLTGVTHQTTDMSYTMSENGSVEEYRSGSQNKFYYSEKNLRGIDYIKAGKRRSYYKLQFKDDGSLHRFELKDSLGAIHGGYYQVKTQRNGEISRILKDTRRGVSEFLPNQVLVPVLPHQYFDY